MTMTKNQCFIIIPKSLRAILSKLKTHPREPYYHVIELLYLARYDKGFDEMFLEKKAKIKEAEK